MSVIRQYLKDNGLYLKNGKTFRKRCLVKGEFTRIFKKLLSVFLRMRKNLLIKESKAGNISRKKIEG